MWEHKPEMFIPTIAYKPSVLYILLNRLMQYTFPTFHITIRTSNCKDIKLVTSVSLIQQLGEISEQMENIILRKGLNFENK